MGHEADDCEVAHTDRRRWPAAERARRRWGVDRVLHTHRPRAAEADVARQLLRHLRHLPVALLHDRELPSGPAHLAVGPGGVTVIVEAALFGPLRVETLHGAFSAIAEMLLDGDTDVSPLAEDVDAKVAATRALTALCRVAGGPPLLRPLHVGEVLVDDSEAVARLAARDGDLSDTELTAVVDLLDRVCPPAA
jgi:hypothetical protein